MPGEIAKNRALELAHEAAEVVEPRGGPIPEVLPPALAALARNIRAMEAFVESELEYGPDWGKEKGIDSDFLKEPGAERIFAAYNCYPRPVVLEREIDDSKNLCSYTLLCEAVSRDSGKVVATGMGVASTRETKWGKRWVWERELQRMGYSGEGLRTRKVHPRDRDTGEVRTETQYQVPNESWGDLVHTLEDIAYKRAKVECAQSLPGARTALRRLFNPDLKFSQFWQDMNSAGANGELVHQILGVESVKDWVASGRTLEEAKRVVLEQLRRRKVAAADKRPAAEKPASSAPENPFQDPPAGAPDAPEEDLFPSDPREVVRQEVLHLLTRGPAPSANQIGKWWDDQGFGYRLLPADLAKPFTGSEVLLSHLEAFRNGLLAYQNRAKKGKAEPARQPELVPGDEL